MNKNESVIIKKNYKKEALERGGNQTHSSYLANEVKHKSKYGKAGGGNSMGFKTNLQSNEDVNYPIGVKYSVDANGTVLSEPVLYPQANGKIQTRDLDIVHFLIERSFTPNDLSRAEDTNLQLLDKLKEELEKTPELDRSHVQSQIDIIQRQVDNIKLAKEKEQRITANVKPEVDFVFTSYRVLSDFLSSNQQYSGHTINYGSVQESIKRLKDLGFITSVSPSGDGTYFYIDKSKLHVSHELDSSAIDPNHVALMSKRPRRVKDFLHVLRFKNKGEFDGTIDDLISGSGLSKQSLRLTLKELKTMGVIKGYRIGDSNNTVQVKF